VSELPISKQPQVFEAIAHDTTSFASLFLSIREHPKAGLLSPALLPPASMYVVESHRAIKKLAPGVAAALLEEFVNRVRPSRHRAKLLGGAEKSVGQVAIDLAEVAERQKRFFLEPHSGMLGPLKRAIQPDLGFSTYDGHIFATTHATAFSFGHDHDLAERAFSIGEALGAYTATLLTMLGLQMPVPAPASALPGVIEMRDIKSPALYRRGPLGKTPTELAAGMTLLLASLNQMRYIMQKLLPVGGHTQFRLKFIVAYHADSNLRAIQDRLASDSLLPEDTASIFREILGNPDSRWLRKRTDLRNLLAHYMVDERHVTALSPATDRTKMIEHFGGDLTYTEMDALLDRHIERMSLTLENGFALIGDPFWYGRVS
jgi:hypothetical protein